jgi:signal transduction histidine kinase/CheY-like chemotaxis protein
MNLSQLLAPGELDRTAEMRKRKLAGASETRYMLEVLTKAGRRRKVEISSRLIFEGGRAIGVQGIARDVTEERALEERMRRSQKMEAVGRTAGGVAHEFNNLLTIITGHTELVLELLPPENPAREELIEIGRAAERAARVTRELLTISRHRVSSPRLINLNHLVSRMGVLLDPLLGDEIAFRVTLGQEELNVEIDPDLLEQVILNLAFNARDAMPHGGELLIATSKIRLEGDAAQRRQLQEGNYAVLKVVDTGIGMDAETQSRIFEPFFTTKEVGKGTGLGLAVVFGVVSQSKGQVEVESAPGRGSTFTIHLPLARHRLEPPPIRREKASDGWRGAGTILLVEDDASVRQVVRRVLGLKGYRVLEAESGVEALELLRSEKTGVDLVITDVVMPRMRGPELAKQLKTVSPETRVLFISGYAEEQSWHEVGDGLFLQKPFTPETLLEKVREMLEARRAATFPIAK